LGTFLIGVLSLIWGSTWLVIKVGLQDVPPFLGAGLRFAVAAVVMLAMVRRYGAKEGGDVPPAWLWLTTGTIQAMSYGFVYTASETLPSGLTALLWSSFPLVFAVMAHLFLHNDRLRSGQWVGMVVGLLGVFVLMRVELPEVATQAELIRASLILLMSPLVVSISTILVKRHGSNCNSMILTRNGILVGGTWLLLLACLTGESQRAVLGTRAVLTILYLGIVGTAASFTIYYWLLRYERATRLSVISYISPVIALFLGALILGETITGRSLLGAAIVLLGVWMASRRPPRGARP
jgi:drug/metabolite transporter (DMT)-like permease